MLFSFIYVVYTDVVYVVGQPVVRVGLELDVRGFVCRSVAETCTVCNNKFDIESLTESCWTYIFF
jgi:hypothetical protein